ncbi:MAG: hypothetical protein GC136_04760 [Alphaproteobacteria bacterium]|nr:hypothetical protein [Alphaproteobacteria bacterium]
MRSALFLFLTTIFFHTAAFAQTADSSWCRANVAPRINVVPTTETVRYDFAQSKKQLDTFKIDTENPYGSNVITDVGGLMKGGIETKQNASYGIISNPNTDQTCMWISEISVGIKISPLIYIASEYPRGTCEHKAIMEHENKHVEVDRQLVNAYAQLMGQEYFRLLQQKPLYGPFPTAQKDAYAQHINTESVNIFNALVQRMEAERKLRQQQVDNINEYESVQAKCPNGRFAH